VLDGFGSGVSSLVTLERFPLDQIKLDSSVLDAAAPDAGADRAELWVRLAHALDRRVIAAGVRSARQLEALRRAGCDAARGEAVGLPATAAGLAPKLRLRRSHHAPTANIAGL
jgi:diguanylate cyclase